MSKIKKSPRIVIVGSGVIGLSTGVCLQQTIPGVEVTIVADAFNEDITSYGAAGIVRCSSFHHGIGPTPELSRRWFEDTYKFFGELSQSADCGKAGVSRTSGYFFGATENEVVSVETLVDQTNEIVELSREDIVKITPDPEITSGKLITTYVADSSYFLFYLQARFKKNGGKTEIRTVSTLTEFAGKYDVVINCTGLRAKELVNDDSVYAVRGQVFKVIAPWIKHFYYRTINCYVIPGIDYVTVGGTRQLSDHSTSIDTYDSLKIMDRATQLLPSLKNAQVAKQWAGLRPQRDTIRVEKEIFTLGDEKIKVVHNYGHGGYGVTLSWGTARYATELVLEFLQGSGLVNTKNIRISARL